MLTPVIVVATASQGQIVSPLPILSSSTRLDFKWLTGQIYLDFVGNPEVFSRTHSCLIKLFAPLQSTAAGLATVVRQ